MVCGPGGAMASSLNTKKWVIASVVVFVAYAILEGVFHGFIMRDMYMQYKEYWNPEDVMRQRTWLMWIAYLVFAFAFVFIFAKGYEGRGMAEGFRYGLYLGFLIQVPRAFISYAVLPYPGRLDLAWLVGETVVYIILGLVAAAIYKPTAAQ